MTALLAVGSYTQAYGDFRARGEGLSLVGLAADGSLSLLDRLNLPNPAYLRPDPARGLLHVALETGTEAAIATIRVDRAARRLVPLATLEMPGTVLCHLDEHPHGGWIAATCYGSGHLAIRRLSAEGLPQTGTGDDLRRAGASCHPVRQTTAHPHAVRFAPTGDWLVVTDLGTDDIAAYPFDAATGLLGPARVENAPAGSGPRLALFDPSGCFLLVVHELDCSVSCYAWDNGALRCLSRHPTLARPPGAGDTAAGLRWHPSGRVFAASTRGADCITLFGFREGAISLLGTAPSGGAKPRDFAFSPCGNFLIVANQDGDSLQVFPLDARTHAPATRMASLEVRSPACVRFLGC